MPRIALRYALVTAGALVALSAALADPRIQTQRLDCTRLPNEAASALPAPLDGWARIDCRPFGQLLVQGAGWQWRYSGSFTQEVMVAAIMGATAEEAGGARFFREFTVTERGGEDLLALDRSLKQDVASYAFLAGDETPRSAYTVRAINDLLDLITVHFLERAEGDLLAVACTPECRAENVFLVRRLGS